jgi:hypothetical protein
VQVSIWIVIVLIVVALALAWYVRGVAEEWKRDDHALPFFRSSGFRDAPVANGGVEYDAMGNRIDSVEPTEAETMPGTVCERVVSPLDATQKLQQTAAANERDRIIAVLQAKYADKEVRCSVQYLARLIRASVPE